LRNFHTFCVAASSLPPLFSRRLARNYSLHRLASCCWRASQEWSSFFVGFGEVAYRSELSRETTQTRVAARRKAAQIARPLADSRRSIRVGRRPVTECRNLLDSIHLSQRKLTPSLVALRSGSPRSFGTASSTL